MSKRDRQALVVLVSVAALIAVAAVGIVASRDHTHRSASVRRAAVAPTLPLIYACFNSAHQIESTRVGYGVQPTCAHSVPPDKIIPWASVAPPTSSTTTTTTAGGTTTSTTGAPTTTSTSTTTTSTTRPATTTTGTTTTTTQPPPSGLAFDDEFDGSSVNAGLWEQQWYGTPGPVNKGGEVACYSPAQNAVSGGYLHMTAVAGGSCGLPYSTGFVDTRLSFTFTTGTLTFRAFLPGDPTGVYNWPALWTDGTGVWPQTGESDVMEGLSGHATCTYHSPVGGQGCNAGGASGWHTYGETVIPGRVQYFYDGQLVGSITNQTVGFHPHFLIMSNQMGQYGGKLVAPTEMLVDYVRVTKVT